MGELKRRHSSVLLTADEVFGIIEGASRGAQDDSRRASSSSGVFSDADQGSDSDASESTTNSYMKKSSSAMKEGFPALEESPLEQRGTSDAAVPGADGSGKSNFMRLFVHISLWQNKGVNVLVF